MNGLLVGLLGLAGGIAIGYAVRGYVEAEGKVAATSPSSTGSLTAAQQQALSQLTPAQLAALVAQLQAPRPQ